MSTKIQADEISSIIKERIDNFELNVDINETGKIISFADGIAKVYGIKNVMAGEIVEFENGAIEKVLPKKNYIPRPNVANIDQIVIVSAVKEPELSFEQLNRYIAFAKYYNIPTELCFNKKSYENLIVEKDEESQRIYFRCKIEQEKELAKYNRGI